MVSLLDAGLSLDEKLPIATFSAIPGQGSARLLSWRYQERLKRSLKVYLQKIEEMFKMRLPLQERVIDSLDTTRRFSPEIFSFYVHLRDGYGSGNLHTIFDTLQMMSLVHEENLHSKERKVGTILTEWWETPFIAELRAVQHLNEKGEPLTQTVRMLPLIHWSDKDFPPSEMKEAERWIFELDEGLWEEFETYVASIKLFSGRVMEGVTAARFFGNIFLRLPHPEEDPLLFYFEHIIHEASHLHLYAMMGEDPLILNEESERYSSPIRVDKRPMSGIFHAVFVLARIIRALHRYCHHVPSHAKAHTIVSNCEKLFLEGLETVRCHARLTPCGQALFETLHPCAFEPARC